jgi:hypothetical protein
MSGSSARRFFENLNVPLDKAKTVKRGGTHIQNCPHPLGKPTERSPNPLYCSDSSEDSA